VEAAETAGPAPRELTTSSMSTMVAPDGSPLLNAVSADHCARPDASERTTAGVHRARVWCRSGPRPSRLRRDDTAPSSLEDSGPDPRASHRMSAETRIHTLPASRSRSAVGRPSQSRPRVDERLLFRRWHSTRAVADRDAIVERFLPLARQLALRYSGRLEPFEDLYQVACLALVKAVERYEPERPEAFSSYAVPSILGELKRHFRDRTWVIRVPRALQELAVTVQRTEAQMAADLGRRPTVAELARATSATEGAVRDALRALDARSPGSLDRPVAHADGEGHTVGERLGAEESGYRQAEHRAHVDRLLERLSGRHRTVIRLRFVEDLTQREIGERIGVSQMDAYRLLRQALDLMYEEELRPRARVAGL
jgi:RNA polymerase sigma-B factor